MISKEALCNKIHELYPQIGVCDIDLKVDWDEERNAWAVDFKKGVHRIKHYLENKVAKHRKEKPIRGFYIWIRLHK